MPVDPVGQPPECLGAAGDMPHLLHVAPDRERRGDRRHAVAEDEACIEPDGGCAAADAPGVTVRYETPDPALYVSMCHLAFGPARLARET